MTTEIPRWAYERMEEERCRFLNVEPNPLNIDVFSSAGRVKRSRRQ